MNLEEYGQVKLHQLNPIILTIDDFCTSEETQWLLSQVQEMEFAPATVYTDGEYKQVEDVRSARDAQDERRTVELFSNVRRRIASLLQLSAATCETTVIQYQPGQDYKTHLDAGSSPEQNSYSRIFTAVLYLNDDFEGGQTHFKHLNLDLIPKAGRLAIWSNKRPNGTEAHPLSAHSGEPVLSGTKWIASFWLHRPDQAPGYMTSAGSR